MLWKFLIGVANVFLYFIFAVILFDRFNSINIILFYWGINFFDDLMYINNMYKLLNYYDTIFYKSNYSVDIINDNKNDVIDNIQIKVLIIGAEAYIIAVIVVILLIIND